MWLKVTDDKAYFATHFVHVETTDEIRERVNLQVETDGVVCYNTDELAATTKTLDELGANYTVEDLVVDPAFVTKAEGVKYSTPEEVKKHLLEDAEPESAVIPNLKKKLAEKDNELKTVQSHLENINADIKQLADAYSKLEARLNQIKPPL